MKSDEASFVFAHLIVALTLRRDVYPRASIPHPIR